ncbi:MAG: 50S ribosomal protein L18 [Bacteroidales bacterium]|mgnify:CR=1 FL=1|jgi:large subunit ribosomal protein L18|nr:50S ribosomal protein L18 [Bacteroidales bacterium]MDD2687077.1 50S ribosomal protein L18 [Bacteroidales bacterium]MDD3330659.1 50S ribosomal protein L18 [Bacteroidales bacterium]MDD3691526.1 50S ribosomal protein L18 [Bacteroidales bacterium]MDD4044986.1 50S ribosomal protein L18 [Bacteroidales bacterium]
MGTKNRKSFRRLRIKNRIRKTIIGTEQCPRLTVFRSNKQIYAQIINDKTGTTLVSASSMLDAIENQEITKIEKAKLVGKDLASKAKEAGITTVVFDRNGYLYHGRVKSLAEAVREEGLIF